MCAQKTAEPELSCWRIDSETRTAVFATFDNGCPALVYFGLKLPRDEALETIAKLAIPNVAGGQLDPLVPLTLIPSAMNGWQGSPGVTVRFDDPSYVPDLRMAAVESDETKLTFQITDHKIGLRISLLAKLDSEASVLSLRWLPCVNANVALQWLAPSVPIPALMNRIVDHGGRWCGEFQRQERCFHTGQCVRESREGRTGHAHFPGVAFLADQTDKTSGACMAVAMCWSGGHKMIAEQLSDGRRHVQFGMAGDQHDTHCDTPAEIWIAWSDTGTNGLTASMTRKLRRALPKTAGRPVHYNCWEAVYFRHDPDELMNIATRAAELGAERFVLDDGWFKNRNDDTTSLGDWIVDPAKYPRGLALLVDHVVGLGMEFGIWFEPEMVNRESDLCKAHPDWILGPAGQPAGRNQYVLDLNKPGVEDYLYDAIGAILMAHPVTYIKWDHNRVLTGATSAQTHALYRLMARLNDAYPHVEIESCASGGGRVDYGILHHATRVWLSDSNDAQERLRMQHEASQWLPPEVQGSHVGPRQCHTSGRVFSMDFRAWVAAQRHMGFEMDPSELDDEERATLKHVTRWYKDNRVFLHTADYHRLESNDPTVYAEIFVATDKSRFILFKGQSDPSGSIATLPFSLSGLDANALYDVRLVNPEAVPNVINRFSATQTGSGDCVRVSGTALMAGALRLPNAFPATMFVFEGIKRHPSMEQAA